MNLILLGAMLAQAAFPPPMGATCVAAKAGEGNKVIFVATPAKLVELRSANELAGNRLSAIACPVAWTPETTSRLCDKFDSFSDDLKSGFTDLYGVSPDDMCEAGRDVDALQQAG